MIAILSHVLLLVVLGALRVIIHIVLEQAISHSRARVVCVHLVVVIRVRESLVTVHVPLVACESCVLGHRCGASHVVGS